jgi:CelD/BcsL family acetyltransferase involved in cellulose biosynthesis
VNLSVDWTGCTDWEGYYRSLLKLEKGDNERRRRRLAELGQLTFEAVEGALCEPLIDWTHVNRAPQRIMPEDRRKPDPHRKLFMLASLQKVAQGRLVTFALSLEGEVIATLMCRVDRFRVEALRTAYDTSLARYAPGKILWGACLKWAFERSLMFDMGRGDYPYKRRWANRESWAFDYAVANSILYRLSLRYHAVKPLISRYRTVKTELHRRLLSGTATRELTPAGCYGDGHREKSA